MVESHKLLFTETEAKRRAWEPALDNLVEERLRTADSSHDILHVQRVGNLTLEIANRVGLSPKELQIAKAVSKGHDTVTYRKNDPRAGTETEESAEIVGDFLQKQTDFNPELIPDVRRGIRQSSFSRGETPEVLHAQVVFTADKLDQLGAIGFARYGASSFHMKRVLHHPDDPMAELKREMDVMEYAIDAIKDRKPKIAKKLFTNAAKVVGQIRLKREYAYLEGIAQELEEEKALYKQKNYEKIFQIRETGMIFVYRVFEEAGEKSQRFYNQEDPFAENREPEPDKYPIDRLLDSQRKMRKDLEQGSFDKDIEQFIRERFAKVGQYLKDFKSEIKPTDFDLIPDQPPTPHSLLEQGQ